MKVIKEKFEDFIYVLKDMMRCAKANKPLVVRLIFASIMAIVVEMVAWIAVIDYCFLETAAHAARVSGPAWLEAIIFFGSFILIAVVGDVITLNGTTWLYERKHEIVYPEDEDEVEEEIPEDIEA